MSFQPIRVAVFVLACGCTAGPAAMTPEQVRALPSPAARRVDFRRDIQPIFEASCVKCHGRGKEKGDFRLDTRESFLKGGESGPVIVPGQSTASLLIKLVVGFDPDSIMPQKGSRLTPAQIGLLRAWIDQGVAWDAGVTFAKRPSKNLQPRLPDLPPATGATAHPVDRLLKSYSQANQIHPASPVSDLVFARRVFLDVIGLLPSPQELDDFLNDPRSDRRGRLVDLLLADNRRYAEHWLTFWNDLLRNDYRGTGYIDGGRKSISSWLYSALATNMPYDQFVRQLVDPVPESEGFAKGIVWRGAVNASQSPPMQTAQNIGQVFLGVNLKCASCHDSFVSDWTLADAYGMAAVYADGPLEMFRCDKPTGKTVTARFLYSGLGEIKSDAPKLERQKRLAELLTSKANGRLSRTVVNRLWKQFFGVALVEPVDDMEQTAWDQDLLDWLGEDLVAHNYDLKHTIRVILTSTAYQLPAVSLTEQRAADYVFTGPAVRRMDAEQFRDALGALTGVWYEKPEATVNRAEGTTANSNLMVRPAQWIWSSPQATQKAPAEEVLFRKTIQLPRLPDEAMTVVACDNSFTLYLNGKKVASGKDFTKPSFADLRPFLKEGENVIAVAAVNHRLDNSVPVAGQPPVEAEANPAGLWLYARLRLAGEVWDCATDGSWLWSKSRTNNWDKPGLDTSEWHSSAELGGPNAAPWNLGRQLTQTMSTALLHGDVRASLVSADPLAVALGRPNREQVNTTRTSAATTLQALELTNGETLSKLLGRGAEKWLAGRPASPVALADDVYRKALGRSPTASERKLAVEMLGEPLRKEGVEDLLWAVTMLPEFQLIY